MIILLIFACLLSTYANEEEKFFRKDYKYIKSTESFYKFQTLRTIWTEANRICELEGADFFYPENNQEADAILRFWNNETQPFEWIYVAISDLVVKGVFETNDGIPVGDVYNNWQPGEPNDADGVEDCVVLNKKGTYNDVPCSQKQPFLCKKRLSALEWNRPCHMPNLDYIFDEVQCKCYKFHYNAMSWTDAYRTCSAEQSYLAVVDSEEEMYHLTNWLRALIGDMSNGTIHMGIHDRLGLGWRTSKGTTLDKLGYNVWAADLRPDGHSQRTEEKCSAMSNTGLLHVIRCDKKSFFICEHDVEVDRSQDYLFTPPPY